MTKGWDICIEWRDGTISWLPLKDVKQSNPIEMAEYAIANKISDEPTFVWWVPDIMWKKNHTVNKLKTKYWRTSHKFGIEIPKLVKHALQINHKTGTDHWQCAIEKEMKNIHIAFQKWDGGGLKVARTKSINGSLISFQEIQCHMISNIKMDGDLTHKAHFVAGGHTTDFPESTTYSSVVSHESV